MHLNEGNNNINNEEEKIIIEKLKISMYLLFILSFFRLFCTQFYCLITDLIAAFIVYCTYKGKGSTMSLFCLINSILGVIYSISIGSMDLSRLNNSINNQKSINVNNPYFTYSNNNNNKFNYFDAGSQENFNHLYNSGIGFNNYKNNNEYIHKNILNNNFYNQDSANFTIIYITIVMIYAVILYIMISFFSYEAYKIFKNPFSDIFESEENIYSNGYININNNNNNENFNRNNYGGTENNNIQQQRN
jgi:hypothetical protein